MHSLTPPKTVLSQTVPVDKMNAIDQSVSRSGYIIACGGEVVLAFSWREGIDDAPNKLRCKCS